MVRQEYIAQILLLNHTKLVYSYVHYSLCWSYRVSGNAGVMMCHSVSQPQIVTLPEPTQQEPIRHCSLDKGADNYVWQTNGVKSCRFYGHTNPAENSDKTGGVNDYCFCIL